MSEQQKPKNTRSKRPADSPDVKLSKSLSYILRHGAAKENLPIRKDGYLSLESLLKHSKFKSTKPSTISRIVLENAKQRYVFLI